MSSRGSGRSHHRNHRGGGKGGRHQHSSDGNKQKSDRSVDESSPIIQAFREFQKELDSRNDRHERIVKLSRDITIESKRIIFLLQRVSGSSEREDLLKEAAAKLDDLHKTKFIVLAKELQGQDPFQFLRAFSPGLQEYIEAVTFYHYLYGESLVGIEAIKSELTFTEDTSFSLPNENSESVQSTTEVGSGSNAIQRDANETQESNVQSRGLAFDETMKKDGQRIVVPIPPCEYMLGVADFTGELMRMAINSVGAGDLETPSVVTGMIRLIHDAFTTFNNTPRELRHKTRVLSQSLQKVERACYTLRVRGSEIPKHMLADVFSNSNAQDTFMADETDDVYD